MSESPLQPRASRSCRDLRWEWLLGLGMTLLLILAALTWYLPGPIGHHNAIRRLEAEIRHRGEPLTLAELAATCPPIPDEVNAAVPLLELWEKEDPTYWTAVREGRRPLPDCMERTYDSELPFLGENQRKLSPGQRLSPASLQAMESFLETRRDHLEAVRAALQRPQSRFPVRWEEGFLVELPHLAELKYEAHAFRITALLAADRDDPTGALSALQDLVRLSDTLADEPILISQMVRAAILQMTISGSEDLLARQKLSGEELRRLHDLLNSIHPRAMLRRGLIGERALALSLFNTPQERWLGPMGARTMRVMTAVGVTAAGQRLTMESLGELIQVAEGDSPAAFRAAKQIGKAVEKRADGVSGVLSSMTLSGIERALVRHLALEARQSGALVALAVEQYRLRHEGALPDQLKALVPEFLAEIPRDPFDGDPLRYRRTATGYRVYSVGQDLRDDSGEKRTSGSGKLDDESFTVERTEPRP